VPGRRAQATRSTTAGLGPHPDLRVPAPAEDLEFKLDGLPTDSVESVWLSGEANLSCLPHQVPELRRAAWALVELDEAGAALRTISGAAPHGLPQIPQSAEYLAASVLAQRPGRSAQGHGDCANGISHFAGRKRYSVIARAAEARGYASAAVAPEGQGSPRE
jgi:hypothetical protein